MSNKAYVYDPITREFVGVTRLDRDPLGGGFLLPANATTVVPHIEQEKTAIFDLESQKWAQVDDYRDVDVYDIATGQVHTYQALGALPDSVTLVKPEPVEGYVVSGFNREKKAWMYRKNWAGVKVYSTKDGSERVLSESDVEVPSGYTLITRPGEACIWDAKKCDWSLNKEKQAELDAQAEKQAAEAALVNIKQGLQSHIDGVAHGLGFTDGNSVMLYTGFNNPFRALAEAFGAWEASIWVLANEQMALVKAGKKAMPTLTEAVGMIPAFVPPSAN